MPNETTLPPFCELCDEPTRCYQHGLCLEFEVSTADVEAIGNTETPESERVACAVSEQARLMNATFQLDPEKLARMTEDENSEGLYDEEPGFIGCPACRTPGYCYANEQCDPMLVTLRRPPRRDHPR